MPRLITSITFSAGVTALAVSVYAWRGRELHSLQQQLATAKQAGPVAEERSKSVQLLLHIRDLKATGSPGLEAKQLSEKLQSLTPGELNEFCDAVLKEPLPPPVQKIVFEALAGAARKCPGEEATAIFLKLSKRHEDSRRMVEKHIAKWMQKDFSGAVKWVAPHLADGSMEPLRESFREQMKMVVEYTPAMLNAAAHMEKIRQAPEQLRGSLLGEGMKNAKSAADRRTIATAVLNSPEDSMRSRVADMVPTMVAADGFDETARWLNGLPTIDHARGAEARVALTMGEAGNPDIGKRADAILKGANAAAGAEFAGALTAAWLRQDHRAAAEWINAHPGAAWQDQARQAFARGITTSEPADAMKWAFSISEPGLRSETAVHVFTHWKSKDAAAAGAFLAGSTVPDDLRQVLER